MTDTQTDLTEPVVREIIAAFEAPQEGHELAQKLERVWPIIKRALLASVSQPQAERLARARPSYFETATLAKIIGDAICAQLKIEKIRVRVGEDGKDKYQAIFTTPGKALDFSKVAELVQEEYGAAEDELDAAHAEIAALQSEREAAAAAPMQHLRGVLYMLADLHPDYQCDAFQQAMRFYNDASEMKIEPSGIDQDHLLSGRNLQTRIEAAEGEAVVQYQQKLMYLADAIKTLEAAPQDDLEGDVKHGNAEYFRAALAHAAAEARRAAIEESAQVAFETANDADLPEQHWDLARERRQLWACACGRIMSRLRALASPTPQEETR